MKLQVHVNMHWAFVFGVVWTNGKDYLLEYGWLTIMLGPWAIHIHHRENRPLFEKVLK